MIDHANHIERQRKQHAPDESMVTISLTDDVYLRSDNGARVQLGIPLSLHRERVRGQPPFRV
jgi:hypothetical protein